ncbi:MAG: hypothetical protein ACK5PT_00965, partial [Cereibacter sp.]
GHGVADTAQDHPEPGRGFALSGAGVTVVAAGRPGRLFLHPVARGLGGGHLRPVAVFFFGHGRSFRQAGV